MKPIKWGEITELHPSRFVLVEAIKASSSNRKRQLEDVAVIQDYDNPQEAWSGYKELHKLHPARELYGIPYEQKRCRGCRGVFLRSATADMKLQLQHGVPIHTFNLTRNDRSIVLHCVLFDTGCAATVFDTDPLTAIDIHIDFINGRAKRSHLSLDVIAWFSFAYRINAPFYTMFIYFS